MEEKEGERGTEEKGEEVWRGRGRWKEDEGDRERKWDIERGCGR